MIYFLLNSSSENTFTIIETFSIPNPETFLKTIQVFKEIIARSAVCSSIPPSFPINPALSETHLSVLTSLHSHLHSTISKMETIQQQTLSHLKQELEEIKICMESLPWESFNTLSQIIPSYIQPTDLELPTTSSSSPYSLLIEQVPSPLLPLSPIENSSSSFGSLASIFDEVISSDIDNTKPALTETSVKEIITPSPYLKYSTKKQKTTLVHSPTIQARSKEPSTTVFPLLSDNVTQTSTPLTPEQPSTSFLCKSSRKRKVSSKYPSCYTKTAKIAVTSSSITEILTKENLPHLSPVPTTSSIKLFTEGTDDIVASDDEEYLTPTTSTILIPKEQQSSIKDEKLHTSTKKQKITTSIEESATHIKEAFLPIIQAPPSTNKHYFVALMLLTKDHSLVMTYREKIISVYVFLNFLKQVHQSIHTCVHYKCTRYIPEIPQQQSSKKLDLLQALYASVVRNHYFFVKNHASLSTKIQQEVDCILNLLNQKYYATLEEENFDFLEKADDSQHHLDLKTFTETPPQPILNKFNFAWYILKKKAPSKSLWVTHNLISFDKFQQLRSILGNAKNMLNYVEKARKETSLWIDCNDGSVKLPHLPKHSITSNQGFQILQTIIAYNRKCFFKHIAVLEQEIPDTCWKECPFYKETVKTLDKIDKCLCEWKDSLKLPYSNIPLPKTADTMTAISGETIQKINSPQPIQDTSFVQNKPIFIKIVPNTSFNSFTIRPCKRPMVNNFKASCKIAKNLIDSFSYICQDVISEDIPISSKNPLVITKTLFTALCISAFGYHQKTASSKKMSILTPDLINALFDTLKALDQKYCQILDNPYDPSPEIYHPDLQVIITRGNILSLVATRPAAHSFTYTFLSISLKKQHFSILEKTYSHSQPLNLLKLLYDQLCYPLRDIIKLILSSEISTLSGTISESSSLELLHTKGITSSERFTRYETLILCRKILEKLQTQILKDAIFKETSDTCNSIHIQNNLSITLTWLNAHIAHQPLPTTPLPSDLYSLPITVIQISKEICHTYHISHPRLWFQEKNPRLDSLKICAKTTYKLLSYLFNHLLQPKEKIIYQGQTFLDFSSLVPVIYRTVEYEMLQVKKIILIALQRSLSYPLIQKPLRNGFRFLLKCQNLIEAQWRELHTNTPIPSLEDLPEDIKPLLPFTLQDVELLKKDPIFSTSGINLMEIFQHSDDSDQEEELLFDDITPETSSK